jgi:hypothetical protein
MRVDLAGWKRLFPSDRKAGRRPTPGSISTDHQGHPVLLNGPQLIAGLRPGNSITLTNAHAVGVAGIGPVAARQLWVRCIVAMRVKLTGLA